MKLEQLGSYKREAAWGRALVMVTVIFSLCLCLYVYIDSRNFIERQSSRKVVIDRDNHAWLATESEITAADRKIQYEEHVKDFYRLFYSFDAGTFEQSVNRALNLIDGQVGRDLYIKEYVEKPLGREVVENNWILKIEIIKVEVDITTLPARGIIIARQTLVRPAGEVVRNMNAKFMIGNARVSYDNPRGALIQAFDVFDNSRIIDNKKK